MILIANGTLLMIQNMTWGGKQGFQEKPAGEFFVPYHEEVGLSTLAGAGVFGTTHTERGLTWVEVALTGHSKFTLLFCFCYRVCRVQLPLLLIIEVSIVAVAVGVSDVYPANWRTMVPSNKATKGI